MWKRMREQEGLRNYLLFSALETLPLCLPHELNPFLSLQAYTYTCAHLFLKTNSSFPLNIYIHINLSLSLSLIYIPYKLVNPNTYILLQSYTSIPYYIHMYTSKPQHTYSHTYIFLTHFKTQFTHFKLLISCSKHSPICLHIYSYVHNIS